MIRDILDRLYAASDADYFIYTNVDIALMPHFYTAVTQLIETGVDAMVINRRTIAKSPSDPAHLPLMWAQVGEKHPGYDCFVFRRDAYPNFDLGTACIGANWIGRVLAGQRPRACGELQGLRGSPPHLPPRRRPLLEGSPVFRLRPPQRKRAVEDSSEIQGGWKAGGTTASEPIPSGHPAQPAGYTRDTKSPPLVADSGQIMADKTLAQDPIFVVGYPRSGTTLLQALLATQGDLATFPETHFFSTVFAKNAEFRETIDPEFARESLDKIAEKSGINFEAVFTATLEKKGSVPVKDLFEALVLKLYPEGADPACRWLEKTPDHGLCMEHILRFYPQAKFVGIVRNPFHAIHSRTKHFPPKAKDLLGLLANHWVNHLVAFEKFQSRHPGSAFHLRYEDLTRNPEKIVASACQFLEIDFSPERLGEFQKKAEGIIQPFEHWKKDVKESRIFTRDENPQGIFSWRETLKIQSIVIEKMRGYGYRPQHPLAQRIYNLFL